MDGVKNALTRKLGPLPVWAWAIIGGIGLWYYRSRMAGSSASQQALQSDLSQTSPMPPQDPIPLDPGESVYDPNSGELLSAPSNQPTKPPTINVNVPAQAPPGNVTTKTNRHAKPKTAHSKTATHHRKQGKNTKTKTTHHRTATTKPHSGSTNRSHKTTAQSSHKGRSRTKAKEPHQQQVGSGGHAMTSHHTATGGAPIKPKGTRHATHTTASKRAPTRTHPQAAHKAPAPAHHAPAKAAPPKHAKPAKHDTPKKGKW